MTSHELQPVSEPGRRMVALAEEHAKAAAERAADHDRNGTFPVETFDEMKASGFLAAAVPEEYGGGGVTSAYDVAVALNRLARGDGSTAIATNMHMAFAFGAQRVFREASGTGDAPTAEAAEGMMRLIGGGTIMMANATEPGTSNRWPLTEAVPVEGGYAIRGRKTFSTLSPIADGFFVPCRVKEADGTWASASAIVFRGMPGQVIRDNWDALGMRASGSHDIVYEDCVVPESLLLRGEGQWGSYSPMGVVVATQGNIGLVSSFLGIAEAAHAHVVEMVKTRTKAPSGTVLAERRGIQHLVAENEVDLVTCRALLEHVGVLIDRALVEQPPGTVEMGDLHQLNREFQAAKLVVNRKAIDIVDRCLTISGGAGYLASSPLSRLYRDVRAGPFMQPFSPVEMHEYIAKVALGLDPTLDEERL